MSTPYVILIYYNDQYVLAQYGKWSGYPGGYGLRIFEFLSTLKNVTALKATL